ncbi:hypothetical protein [Thermus thalpophilus]|uniref:hypothetical protein n=1 Tax=Thermus thalpophilus TaxID=2908147 RepID=UPI001FAAD430|nr:hypothetical protein [Thermus thalpophilus]
MERAKRNLLRLPLYLLGLLLLGGFGGCQLQGSTPVRPECLYLENPQAPYEEIPPELCSGPNSAIYVNHPGQTYDDLNTDFPFTVYGELYQRAATGGPVLGYVSFPGFPQYRFLTYMGKPYAMSAYADSCETQECRDAWVRKAKTSLSDLEGPLFPYIPYEAFPALTGKDGMVGGTWTFVKQRFATRPAAWLRDPYDYLDRLKASPDPLNGKTYVYTQTYTYTPRPGKAPLLQAPTKAEGFRRAPEHDDKPFFRGVLDYGAVWANLYRMPVYQNISTRYIPEFAENQFYWQNLDYYAFQVGQGTATPPAVFCQPGVGWIFSVYFVPYAPRVLPTDYSLIPQDLLNTIDARILFPDVSYHTHHVILAGRDVIGYRNLQGSPTDNWGLGQQGWYRIGLLREDPRYPVFGNGDYPNRTVRLAVLYRTTNRVDWRPNPAHPYGEDNWHIAWSDTYLGGTRDAPDCRLVGLGFHTYDLATSARLDEFFGLQEMSGVPLYNTFYPFNDRVPALSRLTPNGLSNLTEPGAVSLPDWALPPGW